MKHKIYVASSWRNQYYPEVVEFLRAEGHEVYDFRNPPSGDHGFKWECVDPDYRQWNAEIFRHKLYNDAKAQRQLHNDIEAMQACDVCVLVLPCGRSAHTEAGWFAGSGKQVIAYIPEYDEPELMYGLFHSIATTLPELAHQLH